MLDADEGMDSLTPDPSVGPLSRPVFSAVNESTRRVRPADKRTGGLNWRFVELEGLKRAKGRNEGSFGEDYRFNRKRVDLGVTQRMKGTATKELTLLDHSFLTSKIQMFYER